MATDSGLAFVVIQHLDPSQVSYMAGLLGKCTAMNVVQAEDRMPIRTNCVYTIPPNKFLFVKNAVLHLTEPVKRDGLRMPIDFFLRALAQDQHENAIAVIFSGSGSDGTLGIREIHSAGGIVMVQDPKTAQFDSMIQSAVSTGMVDYVLPVRGMPAALLQYRQQSTVRLINADSEATPNGFSAILHLLSSQSKNEFRFYKHATLQRRIARRMGLHRINEFAEYYRYLQENPDEIEKLAKEVVIGVTSFFRDPDAFAELSEKVIKPLVQEKKTDSALRVWVAGCATGEESYSVAMLFMEEMARSKRNLPFHVFASDIDQAVLKYAREGTYPESISADVQEERLARFFIKKEHTSVVSQRWPVGRR